MDTSKREPLYAHTPNPAGQWHGLEAHLRGTAARARAFGAELGPEAADLAYYAGLWHDLGKASSQFQQYLREMAAGTGRRGTGGDHKGAGAVAAASVCQPLAFLVAGHHGGLPASADLKSLFREWQQAPHVHEAQAAARECLAPLLASPGALPFPEFVTDEHRLELFLRMLFSCLVDADFLDTEAHFDVERTAQRVQPPPRLDALLQRFVDDQERLMARSLWTAVNEVRAQVYRAAMEAADQAPGLFRLTVPTGGGKTRAGLGFGLRHAVTNNLRRIIFAIPFTSITEQTATAYRSIFGDEADVVLEDHSAVRQPDLADAPSQAETWRRLAAENWDAPIVVTTTVQLFESLLGCATSACRNVHNVAGSVIVLDEAQTLPPRLLASLLDVVDDLVAHYRVSVVFCTATQPAFDLIPGVARIRAAREIAPDPPALFRILKRVEYEWPAAGSFGAAWSEVATRMRDAPQALAIVNTKKDALALLDALKDSSALHLSTLLCGAHRRDALALVRARLKGNQPCRLVSTQVIEAGVDVDFPFVLRALGPLDSIVQAAGRCNREGTLPRLGRMLVFDPVDGHTPPGAYRVAAGSTQTLLAGGAIDADDPATFERFYRFFYGLVDTDAKQVQARRRELDFPETARRARLIDDDTLTVIVRYRGPRGNDETVDELLDRLAQNVSVPARSRTIRRALQPYVVGLRRYDARRYQADGLIKEVIPGADVWEWMGSYDPVCGIQAALDPDLLVI